MKSIEFYYIFLILLVFELITIESWNTPPFRKPDPLDEAVKYINYDANTKRTIIELNEEVKHSVCIAEINNFDDLEEPKIGRFDSGNNYLLGARLQKENGIWKVFIDNKQDYETPTMRRYIFLIDGGASSSYGIDLYIQNIDDNAPIIRPDQQNCAIIENYKGKTNCSYTIRDDDGYINNTKLTFSSSPHEGLESFSFNTQIISDYELQTYLNVKKSLDFEIISMYMLTIKTIDGNNNEESLTSVIQVIDMPDEPPKWIHLTASEAIKEKSNHTFNVLAIDGDIQINAEINYRIVTEHESEKNLYTIGTNSGKITINAIDRDYLQKEVFKFRVIAYEKEDTHSEINATIIIIVEDVNDHIPEISPENLTIVIKEESYVTLNFDPQISISDLDLADNAQYSVHLTDDSKYNWSSAFLIVPNTGYQTTNFTISVINASLLDYEDKNWRAIKIQIEAVEAHDPSHIGRKTINVNLENWNDELPIFQYETLEVSIPEDVEKNSVIATMLATDRDIDDSVKHSLVAQKVLKIDEKTGKITTIVNNSLDYETMPVVVVQVVATDRVNHTAYGTLTINVTDVNDVPPKLYLPNSIPSLIEEKPLNYTIDTVIYANDPDTDAKLVFNIDWDSTVALKSSVIVNQSYYREHLSIRSNYVENNAEGILVVSGRIDYEKLDVMFINISVTDEMTKHNENTTYASLTLNIIDINDNSPNFNEIKQMSVNENQVFNTIIGSVTASDDDGPCNNQVSYYIEPTNGTENDLVQINKKTGEIRVKKDRGIDAEKYEFLYYIVTATDGNNKNTTQIEIYVIDMNDNQPYLLTDKFNSTIHIREKSPNGTEIVTIYAKDRDREYPNNNVSYLINSNYSAPFQYFHLDKFHGLLQVSLIDGCILDRDFGLKSHILNLKLRDNYVDNITWNSNAIDTVITVILDDINDQIPKLRELTFPTTVNEYTIENTSIVNITVDDFDDPATDNTKVIYKILNTSLIDQESYGLSNECKNPFKVETVNFTHANILTNRSLLGCYGTWAIDLYAQDLGTYPGPLNDSKTYHIQITDYNYNAPKITNPFKGQKIALSENQTLHTTLKTYDYQPLNDFTAEDKDHGASGTVTFEISSDSNDHEFFSIVKTKKNTAQLQLINLPNIAEKKTYRMTLTAKDQGIPSKNVSHEFSITFVSTRGPEFDQHEWTVWIKENTINQSFIILKARDNIEDSNTILIYYFIDDKVGDHEFFQLNKVTGELSLKKKLDREMQDIMTILIIATSDSSAPPRDPRKEACLNITVIVLDENDNPPIFQSKLYSAGVAMGDSIDNVILTVKAMDADLNDTLTYFITNGAINISDPSLNEALEISPFTLNQNSGELLLKFSLEKNMVGFFSFAITVYDAIQHSDTSLVQVYIISQDNRVEFTFRNNASYISEEKLFIIEAFSNSFKYLCNIDKITGSSAGNDALNNKTTVTSHFIDSTDNLPITADAVVLASGNLQTITNVKALLQARSLYLIDVPTGSSSIANNVEQTVHWILISLTIFFSLCSIALLVAYFIRTKSLLQRLDNMAIARKFESNEGLDKVNAVPTTNHFALSGSNPIWNSSKPVIDFGENISQKSGDSDLIGIEDDPHFGYNDENNITLEKNLNATIITNGKFAERAKIIFDNSFGKEDEYSEEDNKC